MDRAFGEFMIGLWNYMSTRQDMIAERFIEHFQLISIAIVVAVIVGVGLGLLSAYYKPVANVILTISQVLMTIPSLAMMAMLLPIFRIGFINALVALVLYSLLPIVRNTYTGIKEINPKLLETAKGMGMTEKRILWRVKIPIALPVIIAGIRTATVMLVGIGAIASYIGAGGLGVFIFRGISRTNPNMIVTGALGVAVMAVGLDLIFSWAERIMMARQS